MADDPIEPNPNEPIVLGSTTAQLQGLSYSYSPWSGNQQRYHYEGSHSGIAVVEASVKASGMEYEVDYSKPKATLSYYDAAGAAADNDGETWELRGNDISKPLASHQNFDGIEAQMVEADQVLNGTHPTYKSDEEKTAIEKYTEAKDPPVALLEYMALRAAGVSSYLEAGYRIIQSVTTSSLSIYKASMSGVMSVSTPPVPSSAKFSPPSGQWLKKAPQVYDMGHGRLRITQEWVWAEKWSSALYEGGNWSPSV